MLPGVNLDARALVQPLGLENAWTELGDGVVEYWGHTIRVINYNAVDNGDEDGANTSAASPPAARAGTEEQLDQEAAGDYEGMARESASSSDDFATDNTTEAPEKPAAGDDASPEKGGGRTVMIVLEDTIDESTPFVGETSCIVWNSVAQNLSFCLMFVSEVGFAAAWSALHALQGKPAEPLRFDALQCCRAPPLPALRAEDESPAPQEVTTADEPLLRSAGGEEVRVSSPVVVECEKPSGGKAAGGGDESTPTAAAVLAKSMSEDVVRTTSDEEVSAAAADTSKATAGADEQQQGRGTTTKDDVDDDGKTPLPRLSYADVIAPPASGDRRSGLGFIEKHVIALAIIEFDHGSNPALFSELRTCVTLIKFANPELLKYMCSSNVYAHLVKGLESVSAPPTVWTPPSSLTHLVGAGQKALATILNTILRLHHLRHEVLPVAIDEDVTSVMDSVNHRLQNEAVCLILSDDVLLKAAVQALHALPAPPSTTVAAAGRRRGNSVEHRPAGAAVVGSVGGQHATPCTDEPSTTATTTAAAAALGGTAEPVALSAPPAIKALSPSSLANAATPTMPLGGGSSSEHELFIASHLRFFNSLITLSMQAFSKELVPAVIAKICQSGLLAALSVVLERYVLAPPATPRKTPSRQSSAQSSLGGRPGSSSLNGMSLLDQTAAPALDLPTAADGAVGGGPHLSRSSSQPSMPDDAGASGLQPKSPSPEDGANDTASVDGLSQSSGGTTRSNSTDTASTAQPSQPSQPVEPRPPVAGRPAGTRNLSGRAKISPGPSSSASASSASSLGAHGGFLAYSNAVDVEITALLDATVVRLNEKQDEQSLHEIFRLPILEHPESHHALLTYLVKHITSPLYAFLPSTGAAGSTSSSTASTPMTVTQQQTAGKGAVPAFATAAPLIATQASLPIESGVGLNRFILFHLLGLHDDEGSSSTERTLDPINAAKRDQFHSLIITSYLVPACRGTGALSRGSSKTSLFTAAFATAPADLTPATIATLGISPAFIRLLTYILALSSPTNKLALLDGMLHPKALVLRYTELCAQLSATKPRQIRTDVVCGNVRLLKAIVTLPNAEQGKFWMKVLEGYQRAANMSASDASSGDIPAMSFSDSAGLGGIPDLDTANDGQREVRQIFASRIARAFFAPLIAASSAASASQRHATSIPPDGSSSPPTASAVPAVSIMSSASTSASNHAASTATCVLGAHFALYHASGGARKNGMFHSTVNAMLKVLLDTDLLAPMRRVLAARYRPLLPAFFMRVCDQETLTAALTMIVASADQPAAGGHASATPIAATSSSGGADGRYAGAAAAPTAGPMHSPPLQPLKRPSSNVALYAGGVDEVAPPPDAKQMEDLARFSPALRSSLGRISPAFGAAALGGHEPHDGHLAAVPSRDQSVSPLPHVLPARPGSGGPFSRTASPQNHGLLVPRSPATESLDNRAMATTSSASPHPLDIVDLTSNGAKNGSVASANEPSPATVSDSDTESSGPASVSKALAGKPAATGAAAAGSSSTQPGGRRSSTGALTPTLPKQTRQASSSGVARKSPSPSSASLSPLTSGARSPTNGSRSPGGSAKAKPKK